MINGKKTDMPELLVSSVLEDAWRTIHRDNVPVDTHPLQVKTYKRFFMAGAKALMDTLVYSDTLDDSVGAEVATPQDIKRIDALMHEITAFFADVIAGRQ
jgi:hypothetical protein